ncbi:MAG: PBP1A family penicillin-binding protein [Bacilli bacterium]|nr:PBP1A family penicillin-binding protein [Bacilli bacterium]
MKIIKKLYKIFIISFIIVVGLYCGIYMYAKLSNKLPLDKANKYYLYDSNNNIFSSDTDDWVNLDNISKYLIDATISTEDKKFYEHLGFDYLRILKAIFINAKNVKTVQGASTITQQYAKNLFLDFDKTWKRKLQEAWITIKLEAQYSKDQLLEGYLNTINYGGVYGIENASMYYFGKKAKNLTLAEASMLAGIPKSPSNYSPLVNEKEAKNRQKTILETMVKNKYITEDEKNKAYKEKLTYIGSKKSSELKTLMYYEDAVINELKSINSIPDSFLKTGGLKIYTNLDMNAQTIMENSMNNNIKSENLEVASIMMDPNTGKVLALIGGRDYSKSQYNRAISSKRQVGSTMKPFLYYAALENGFTPSTTFTSEKTTFTFSENKTYSPSNYSDNYANKPISMAAAITYSDNIYAVKTHLFLGEDTLVDFAKRIDLSDNLEAIPSLPLGTNEIKLIDMVKGYSTFANLGYTVEPYFITKVEDSNGNILYERKEKKDKVLNSSITYVLNELLSNCASKEFIDYNNPTCLNIAPKLSRKYSIKTGTTDTDHLIFGYNKDVIVGIWNGYDNNQVTPVTDGANMKNMWADIMENYLKDKDTSWYETPENVVGVLVDPISGEVANNDTAKKTVLYYIKGTEPSFNDPLDSIIPTIKEDETTQQQ